MISTNYYYCFFLSISATPRRRHQQFKGIYISCLLSLFFFLLDLAVDEADADDVESFYLFFAIVLFSSTRRICDCTVAEGLKPRRLEISANLYSLLSAAVEAETEIDDDDLTEAGSCERPA